MTVKRTEEILNSRKFEDKFKTLLTDNVYFYSYRADKLGD